MSSPLAVSFTGIFRGVESRLHEQSSASRATYAIAGIAIRLEFGSKQLEENISPAFRHLRAPDMPEPQLTVFIREDASIFNGARLACEEEAASGENDIWLEDSRLETVILQRQGRFVTVVDWAQRAAYWLVPDASSISYFDRAHPLQQLLNYWLGKQRRFFVHGAAIGNARDGVLILGRGGAGKSTTALSCLEEGMHYVADDHCLVSEEGEEPLVHSIYGTGKVAFDELDRFPLLAAAAQTWNRPEGEKTVLFLATLAAARLPARLRLRAILQACIADLPRTRLRAASRGEAFRAMVGSCALHLPQARAEALQCFTGLVRQLPVYVLELGRDLKSTPAVIRELLASLPE